MKKYFLLSFLITLIIFTFGCKTPNEEVKEEFICNPLFINSSPSSRSAYAIEMDPSELYYAYYCPLLISFKKDNTLVLGTSFERTILMNTVKFQTSKDNSIIKYEGKSDDENILIIILYNTETEEIQYTQVFLLKPTFVFDDRTINDAEMFLYTSFTTKIHDNKIHSPIKYGIVKFDENNESRNMCFAGDAEFYSSESLSGFFIKSCYSGENNKYKNFSLDKSNEIISYIMNQTKAKQMDGMAAVGYYNIEEGSITYYPGLHYASLGMSDYEEVKSRCPWELLKE